MKLDLVAVYHSLHCFYELFKKIEAKRSIDSSQTTRGRKGQLSLPEIMTILLMFHNSGFRTFKDFYIYLIQTHSRDFPTLVSYSRFVSLTKTAFLPLLVYLQLALSGRKTGVYIIDSTPLEVCKMARASANRVFRGIACTGKTSTGWFHGFKLHIVINDEGELISFALSSGNIHDIHLLEPLTKTLAGVLLGDRAYVSQKKSCKLAEQGLKLITGARRNMKNKLLGIKEKALLSKRFLIESVNNLLKNSCQINHSRHRSIWNFLVNVLGSLSSYAHRPTKPTMHRAKYLQKILKAA